VDIVTTRIEAETMDDHEFEIEGELTLVQDVPKPSEFEQILAYQGKQVRPPPGEGSQKFLVLGAVSGPAEGGGFTCFALVHKRGRIPCKEFLEDWRLPTLN